MRNLIFLILLLTSTPSFCATISQVRNKVDTWLSNHWSTVVNRQNNYFTNHGGYWQGLITHSTTTVPSFTSSVDGDVKPDQFSFHPTDQTSSWLDAFSEWESEFFPAALKVDVYSGPSGKGYVATVYVKYNGTIYTRSQNVGPETGWTSGWHIRTEAIDP